LPDTITFIDRAVGYYEEEFNKWEEFKASCWSDGFYAAKGFKGVFKPDYDAVVVVFYF